MRVRTLLVETKPAWFGVDGALLAHAQQSALGRRMLSRWLQAKAPALLAPSPDGAALTTVTAWPRARLQRLIRDLGTLAFAPAIRAEVRREPVRWLKALLGDGYALALDRSLWDGTLDGEAEARVARELREALASQDLARQSLLPRIDRQGRAELDAWCREHAPALDEWSRLLHEPETLPPAHLPPALVARAHAHHLRAAA